MDSKELLSLTESSDFQYLLELMVPLYEDESYAWLPELFSIIGHEKLLLLCKYCGGEEIRIPTVEELLHSIEVLHWYYTVCMVRHKYRKSIPEDLREDVEKIEKFMKEKHVKQHIEIN